MNKIIYSLLLLLCFQINLYSESEDYYPAEQYYEQKELPTHGIVLFGATGDLVKRKIIPSLVSLAAKDKLPQDYVWICVGRRELSQEQFLKHISTFIKEEQLPYWNAVKDKIVYVTGNLDSEELYKKIANVLRRKNVTNHLYYLAIPSDNYPTIVKGLYQEDLLDKDDGYVKVLFEKPFGKDLDSAKALHAQISAYLGKDQASYVDHYLGKSIVRSITGFRKKFEKFELLWNRIFIQSVDITLAEDIGIEGRGAFWEQTGLLRDVVQNHVMQMIGLVAMDMPDNLEGPQLSKNKVQVIKALKAFNLEDEFPQIIRGQYARGIVNNQVAPGYREEKNVSPESNVETFVAANFKIDNYRWKDVPFVVKAGKRLSEKKTQIEIQLKPLLKSGGNRLVFSIHPVEEIYYVDFADNKHTLYTPNDSNDAYENIFEDALQGNFSNFATFKEILAAWKFFSPVLKYWEENAPVDFPNYEAGSEGPEYYFD
ncbi:MAG: hypothetical protein WC222_02820 [Parachlamydiales bacterium]|jgi:glucose-6-phosphate 1-dehydrogenase